jgi:hypothetical protein
VPSKMGNGNFLAITIKNRGATFVPLYQKINYADILLSYIEKRNRQIRNDCEKNLIFKYKSNGGKQF